MQPVQMCVLILPDLFCVPSGLMIWSLPLVKVYQVFICAFAVCILYHQPCLPLPFHSFLDRYEDE